jgi:hypothetical protein
MFFGPYEIGSNVGDVIRMKGLVNKTRGAHGSYLYAGSCFESGTGHKRLEIFSPQQVEQNDGNSARVNRGIVRPVALEHLLNLVENYYMCESPR